MKKLLLPLFLLLTLGAGCATQGLPTDETPSDQAVTTTDDGSNVSSTEEGLEPEDVNATTTTSTEENETEDNGTKKDDTSKGETVTEVTITGANFSFTPSKFTAKKGQKVRVTFKNAGGNHDFKIDEFNVATERLEGGDETVVEFTPDKTGTFEYYCSVGSHRAMGMKGTLTVTE